MRILGYQSLPFKSLLKPKKEQTSGLQISKPAPVSDIFVKKEIKIATIPDFIEFTPAKTIDEAKKFAEENLLIRDYKLTDVDCANYLNEALSDYYNKNGIKRPLVRHVSVAPENNEFFASMGCYDWTMYIGEHMFKRTDDCIDKYLEDETVRKRCDNADETCNLTESQKKYFEYYKKGAKDHSKLPIKEKIGFFLFLRGFSGEEMPVNADGGKALPDGGPFWIINHEIGHLEHLENVGIAEYRKLGAGFRDDMPRKEAKAKFRKMEPAWEAALKVSDYASSSPKEFVADTFACLKNGVKFDDDVMELYQKYGGPKIA